MNFINPAAFWALLTIGIIVLLYFLKLKRQKKVISNLFLFNRMLVDQKANRPFQKLRRNLLLLIQILFLLLSIMGLSRPTFIKNIFSNYNYIILIDSSASMMATDDGESRFERAKERATEIISNFAESDMAMIISADTKTYIRAPLSRDKRALKKNIDTLEPTETPTNLYDAFTVIMSALKQKKIDKIYVISDGANVGLEQLAEERNITKDNFPEVEFISIGKGSDNVGIVDLDINATGNNRENLQVFARIVNFSNEPKTTDVELYNGDDLIDIKEITIPAQENYPVIFDDARLEQGLITMKLSIDDKLEVDNTAYAYMKKPESIQVLMVTKKNMFLENALRVNPVVSLTKMNPFSYDEKSDYSSYDVIIFDSFFPNVTPKTNILLINSEAAPLNILKRVSADGKTAREELPNIIDYDKTHPIMKYINFENTVIAKSTYFSTPGWMQKIVEAEDSTLIYAGEKLGRRVILISFDLTESDFILKSSFPMFIYNSMIWLSDHFDKKSSSYSRTGDSIRRKVYEQDIIEVTTPESDVIEVKVFNDEFFFDNTKWVGLYTTKGADGFEDFFIANLLSEKESDITPSPFIKIGGKKIKPTSKISVRKELWKYFVIFAIIFIIIEWWVYHRKVFY